VEDLRHLNGGVAGEERRLQGPRLATGRQPLPQQKLFVEQGGLGDGWGGFAASYAYYAEDGDFGESRAGDEDAIGVGIQVGRSDLDAVIEEREQIVGDHTFEGLAVQESQPEPEAV